MAGAECERVAHRELDELGVAQRASGDHRRVASVPRRLGVTALESGRLSIAADAGDPQVPDPVRRVRIDDVPSVVTLDRSADR